MDLPIKLEHFDLVVLLCKTLGIKLSSSFQVIRSYGAESEIVASCDGSWHQAT